MTSVSNPPPRQQNIDPRCANDAPDVEIDAEFASAVEEKRGCLNGEPAVIYDLGNNILLCAPSAQLIAKITTNKPCTG